MFYLLSKALSFVGNPSAWGLACVLAAVLVARRPAWAAALATLGAVQLLAFSSPRLVGAVQSRFERMAPATYHRDHQYDVAIVLGGDRDRIESGAEVVERGGGRAFLYTGRISPHGADALVQLLRSRGVPDSRIVIEDRARNTYENAVESADLVARHGWRSLLLVTSAVHMPRALACFRRQGLEPDTLPVGDPMPARSARTWAPSPATLDQSRALLHEVIGSLVYRAVGYST